MTDASHRLGSAAAPLRLPPLYPIIDVDLCGMRGVDPSTFAAACVGAGARILQVRQKGSAGGDGVFLDIVRAVIAAARPAGARVIVNDRADLAAMSGADGVHVGQQDLPPALAQTIAGRHAIVGVSTHTTEQIAEAGVGSADYIAVGPVFRTSTKETGYDPRGLELVRHAARMGKPVVAIGGITVSNARSVLDAGASSVAIISDLLSAADPEARVREFLAIVADER